MPDVVCLLSGLSALKGPNRLIDHEDLDTISTTIASEILSYEDVSLSLENLTSIVSSALQLTLPPREDRIMYDRAPNLPDGVSDWEHFDCTGIGYFDRYGNCYPDEQHRWPSGRDVQVRRLDQYDSYGNFYGVIVNDPDAEDGSGVRLKDERSYCGTANGNSNFYVTYGCLEYLRAWLDPSLPQRVAFMDFAPSMTLEGELYEIINSRPGIRGDGSGLLLGIQYGDISKTLDHFQNRFLSARKGSKHTSLAIKAGLRGTELLPAIFRDFQCWLSMRPDIWPSPTDAPPTSKLMRFPTSHFLHDPFNALPTELLLIILSQLPIPTLLALSAASRNLHGLLTEPAFLNQAIKASVMEGSSFWILPVAAIPGEEERAHRMGMDWLAATVSSENSALVAKPSSPSPFHSPSFPYFAFVRACYGSDSMRNRERLWNIVKQFDDLWRDYRLHGWQADVFVH